MIRLSQFASEPWLVAPCSHHFWCDFWSNYVKLAMRMPGQFTHKINQQNLFILAAHGLNLDQ